MCGMALTRPSLTVQLTSGVDVFAHVCGRNADTSSSYCDNLQPYDKRCFSFCHMRHDFRLQLRTDNFCKVVRQHNEDMVGSGFVENLLVFPPVKEFRKSVKN